MDSTLYTFYCESYLGTALSEEDFAVYALRAKAHLNADTFGRAENVPASDAQTTTALQLCLCALADLLYATHDTAASGALVKETLGSWSRTFDADTAVLAAQVSAIERLYLGSTGLLYRGGHKDVS